MVTAPERVLLPHIKTVVASTATTPVACAQLLLGNGVAGVYYVGTVAAARGRGLAELVTRYVTNLGFERGRRSSRSRRRRWASRSTGAWATGSSPATPPTPASSERVRSGQAARTS